MSADFVDFTMIFFAGGTQRQIIRFTIYPQKASISADTLVLKSSNLKINVVTHEYVNIMPIVLLISRKDY